MAVSAEYPRYPVTNMLAMTNILKYYTFYKVWNIVIDNLLDSRLIYGINSTVV